MARENIRGIAWPFRFGPLGHPNRISGQKRLRQNLEGIALTRVGERFRERDFGTIGYSLVMRNLSDARRTLVSGLSADAMALYEPRVVVHDVRIERRDTPSGHANFLLVPYEVRGTEEGDIGEFKIGD